MQLGLCHREQEDFSSFGVYDHYKGLHLQKILPFGNRETVFLVLLVQSWYLSQKKVNPEWERLLFKRALCSPTAVAVQVPGLCCVRASLAPPYPSRTSPQSAIRGRQRQVAIQSDGYCEVSVPCHTVSP